jgi:hypothetical protein
LKKSLVEGSEVIVKFFSNNKSDSNNPIITRTLGKLGVIHTDCKTKVNSGELWRVKIIKETSPTRSSGCFILTPLVKLEPGDLQKLIPGLYSEVRVQGLSIITPQHQGNWIVSATHKKSIMAKNRGVHAIIVVLSQTETPPTETKEIT